MSEVHSPLLLAFEDIAGTVDHIVSLQRESGLILLASGGAADPWNHVEAAIALDLAGRHEQSDAAYHWLASCQRSDGSWFASYGHDGRPAAGYVDTNAVGYVATGVLAHLASTKHASDAVELFSMVERALDYVLAHEHGGGVVPWAVDEDGDEARLALIAGSSSLVSSLRHGAVLAAALDADGDRWARAADRVARSILDPLSRFADKREFAMDWYYPVLAGVVTGEAALHRLSAGAPSFATEDGVRCRSDRRWVTSAESAEAAIAYARVGDHGTAAAILSTVTDKRVANGGYLTGLVYPERSEFPKGETTSYSSAAVVLATDVLSGGIAAELFGAEPSAVADSPVATSTRRLSAA